MKRRLFGMSKKTIAVLLASLSLCGCSNESVPTVSTDVVDTPDQPVAENTQENTAAEDTRKIQLLNFYLKESSSSNFIDYAEEAWESALKASCNYILGAHPELASEYLNGKSDISNELLGEIKSSMHEFYNADGNYSMDVANLLLKLELNVKDADGHEYSEILQDYIMQDYNTDDVDVILDTENLFMHLRKELSEVTDLNESDRFGIFDIAFGLSDAEATDILKGVNKLYETEDKLVIPCDRYCFVIEKDDAAVARLEALIRDDAWNDPNAIRDMIEPEGEYKGAQVGIIADGGVALYDLAQIGNALEMLEANGEGVSLFQWNGMTNLSKEYSLLKEEGKEFGALSVDVIANNVKVAEDAVIGETDDAGLAITFIDTEELIKRSGGYFDLTKFNSKQSAGTILNRFATGYKSVDAVSDEFNKSLEGGIDIGSFHVSEGNIAKLKKLRHNQAKAEAAVAEGKLSEEASISEISEATGISEGDLIEMYEGAPDGFGETTVTLRMLEQYGWNVLINEEKNTIMITLADVQNGVNLRQSQLMGNEIVISEDSSDVSTEGSSATGNLGGSVGENNFGMTNLMDSIKDNNQTDVEHSLDLEEEKQEQSQSSSGNEGTVGSDIGSDIGSGNGSGSAGTGSNGSGNGTGSGNGGGNGTGNGGTQQTTGNSGNGSGNGTPKVDKEITNKETAPGENKYQGSSKYGTQQDASTNPAVSAVHGWNSKIGAWEITQSSNGRKGFLFPNGSIADYSIIQFYE